jgi:steroid delta-isomerase
MEWRSLEYASRDTWVEITMLKEMLTQGALGRKTGMEDRARAAALAYVESFKSGDIDGRLALFSPAAKFEDPVGTPAHSGHAALRAFWDQGSAIGVTMAVQHIASNADSAAMFFKAALIMEGSEPVELRVIEIFEIDENGLIVRLRSYFDETSIS